MSTLKPLKLESNYAPTGDQPKAIQQLVEGFKLGAKAQVLLGVTGSGKTFTAANVIEQLQMPTLILSHNKTLAAQLYGEFKGFFPNNLVEYYVSYYDYYQPEAYLPVSDTYIEKDLAINSEIEKLRLSTTASLLSGRKDVIVVSSVSCIYGAGNPEDFHSNTIHIAVGDVIAIDVFLRQLVNSLYSRNDNELTRGHFRAKGDTIDVAVAYGDYAYRIVFFGNEVESIRVFDVETQTMGNAVNGASIYPANIFVTTPARLQHAIRLIQDDMVQQCNNFKAQQRFIEAKRLEERVQYDIEMMREVGFCKGIENYSRYFDGRQPGERPFCLIDYFPDEFLLIIDESHVTVPQIQGMYGGDRARKQNLVEYGFRLPAARDNRPLTFEEFESLVGQTLYMSATPADYELAQSGGVIVEQVVRPTGLLDPPIEVRPTYGQIDDLLHEINIRAKKHERVLVTTLTKKMAENLQEFFEDMHVRCRYIHSDVETLDRVKILDDLRAGVFDVLIGVNLLREGLDLPEVSLVAILDADKEGFLRSTRSLTQTVGRAARNVNGRVIMYADNITASMKETMDETDRRRAIQLAYNEAHGITPTPIVKRQSATLGELRGEIHEDAIAAAAPLAMVAEETASYASPKLLKQAIARAEAQMRQAAKSKDYRAAADFRDRMLALQAQLADIEK